MGLFKKEAQRLPMDAPDLPELPPLPEFPGVDSRPRMNMVYPDESLPKLPSFPSNDFGNKFSQNAIKDAISGEEESDYGQFRNGWNESDRAGLRKKEGFGAEEEFPHISSMTQKPLEQTEEKYKPLPRPDYTVPKEFQTAARVVSGSQPVFVKLDKFEASLHAFNESKNKILEAERMLHDVREIREREEKELHQWEQEIQSVKEQMEKIERDLFSRI